MICAVVGAVPLSLIVVYPIGKLMWNTGVLYGAAVACGWEVHRVRPAIWQKAHPVGTKGDLSTTAWKNKLKARAGELYGSVPGIKVTLANADALLILDAAMRGAIIRGSGRKGKCHELPVRTRVLA